MKDDVRSFSHSKWRCKYHIVFAPKYRRQVIYRQLKADIGKILRELSRTRISMIQLCLKQIQLLFQTFFLAFRGTIDNTNRSENRLILLEGV